LNPTVPILILVILGTVFFLLGLIILRFVPIIERNAFEVPRYRIPDGDHPTVFWEIEDISIPAFEHGNIKTRYIRAKKPTKRIIVFCHETGSDLNSWRKHISFLPDAGFDVLTFNFNPLVVGKRYGRNAFLSYQWPTREELRCLEIVLAWIKNNRPDYKVGLFGISKGACIAAAGSVSLPVHAVVLEGIYSTYRTLESYLRRWTSIYIQNEAVVRHVPEWIYRLLSRSALRYAILRQGLEFFSVDSYIPKIKKPIFIIHAGKDAYIPADQVGFIKDSIPGETELWIAQNASHSDTVKAYAADYQTRVKNFFERTLSDSN